MNGRNLEAALRAGKRVYGTCVTCPAPNWPEMIAGTGVDFVFIDTEHIPIMREPLSWMCRMFAKLDIATIVRIPKPDPYQACVALDAGASGVVSPYLETVAEVKELRGAIKLRPLKGQRLYDALNERGPMPGNTAEYVRKRNEGRLLVINVESQPALEVLDDLLAVPDIAAILIGPHDLSVNLGVPEQYDHPTFEKALELIIEKAQANKVGVGMHYSGGIEKSIHWAQKGMNMIVHASDLAVVSQTLSADFARFRRELGDDTGDITAEAQTI